ncbi:MAG: DNA gyrase inhibitor YacG [Verrucomicrobia bacterium]|nr:DNA gyrase inhibitor YacG [Verrucomicrobiota bacterium]
MKPMPKVRCPTCRKLGHWFATSFGPFCSKRCKLVDLGKWFGEENRISEPLRPDHFEELEKYSDEEKPDQRDDEGS